MSIISPLIVALVLSAAGPKNLPLIVIDPGHGGEHDGAHGICGLTEKDVVLSIAKEVADLLRHSGLVTARLTRSDDSDIPLEARAELANSLGARLFISIHANASPNTAARGIETFFLSSDSANRELQKLVERENGGSGQKRPAQSSGVDSILASLRLGASHHESQKLALSIQSQLAGRFGEQERGVLQAPFVVLRHAQMPSVLVEVGFLTHPDECENLATKSYRREISQGIAVALLLNLGKYDGV